jgi:hypothetical protein
VDSSSSQQGSNQAIWEAITRLLSTHTHVRPEKVAEKLAKAIAREVQCASTQLKLRVLLR